MKIRTDVKAGSLTLTVVLCGLAFVLMAGLVGCETKQGPTWPAFGKYRLPYEDGTEVRVSNDFETHSPVGKYDLVGVAGAPGQTEWIIVAAADGWIRFLVDSNEENPDDDPHAHNNYIWIEHPYPFCQPTGVTWPGKPADYDETCIPCLSGDCWNESTKYSHIRKDSGKFANIAVGDFVTAGTILGVEDEVGHANESHLHWELAKLDPSNPLGGQSGQGVPTNHGWVYDWSGGAWVGSPNVLPSICGGIGVMKDGETYTAAPCN